MDIMQARWGAVAVLYQGTVLRIFLFEPHKQTLETIKTAVLEFQNKIEKYKATGEIDYYPPANSKDADRMYPAADEAAVVNLPGRAEQPTRS
jgi:predicted Abi (CAAX) family protease